MNQWCASLILLAVMQIWFYESSPRRIFGACVFYWASIYVSLLACELMRRILIELEMAWWLNVMAGLIAVSVGESAQVLSSFSGKSIERKRQALPSFFSLSALYLVFAWLNRGHFDFLFQSQIEMMAVATLSLVFLLILSGIQERLRLQESPKPFQGLPILMISAAIFLLIFLR